MNAPSELNTVVLVGGGAREHALAWKLRQSSRVGRMYAIPGNPGIAGLDVTCLKNDLKNVVDLAQAIATLKPNLVVVGPEKPLVDGLVDELHSLGIVCFGPTKAAARIEGSKAYAKELMRRADVPTAAFIVAKNFDEAMNYIAKAEGPLVVKADGLCAGKGVVVCSTAADAIDACQSMLVDGVHGDAGRQVVIEKRLTGRELSVMAFCDGQHLALLPVAQDYKRRREADLGPMTGGMGAFSPVPGVDDLLLKRIQNKILEPIVKQMAKEGTPFRGLLYAGLMLTRDGPMVLEFNARFGDPETEVSIPRIRADLYSWLRCCAKGELPATSVPMHERKVVGVVMCSGPYPNGTSIGSPIENSDHLLPWRGEIMQQDVLIFHAGTAMDGERLVTNGGRILCVVAEGQDYEEARMRAYAATGRIEFAGKDCRTDIATGL